MPTNYVVDTNTITALANAHAIALAHLSNLDPADKVFSCFIVVGEWEYGVYNVQGKQRQDQIRAAGVLVFAALTAIIESSPAISIQYGAFQAQLRQAGQMIPTNDLWIAATAHVHQATVVTADPHFRRIAGLSVIDWTQTIAVRIGKIRA